MALKFALKFDRSLVLVAKVGQINLVVLLILSHALCIAFCESFCHLLDVILVDEESSDGEGEQHKMEAPGEG